MPHQIAEIPNPAWRGLDLRSTDRSRDPSSCIFDKNAMVSREGNLTVRPGYQCIATTSGGLGTAKYVYISTTTGEQTVEKLVLGASLYKVNSGSFTITYTPGALLAISASVLIDEDDGHWHFVLYGDGATLLDHDLGLGFDESSPVTLNDLDTAISAISGFAAVPTAGTTSVPAAFLHSIVDQPFVSNVLTIPYSYMSTVAQPSSAANPFAVTYADRNATYFELASHVNVRNCVYFGTAKDEIQKYDSQKIYRAGMPTAATPTASVVVAGSGRTGTNIRYKVQFIQVDKQGNRQSGVISGQSGTVSPAADSVDVSFTHILNTTGFNTDCGMVAGTQAGVTTIDVDNGAGGAHTLKVGDVAYFYDGVSTAFVERTITAVASTTITISGNAVNVTDNAPISANLRVALYTQEVEDGNFYLVSEYPHNSFAGGTQTITDTGATLGDRFFDPLPGTEPSLPPKGKYLSVFKGLMWITGNLSYPNRYFYSDFTSPESFPSVNYEEVTTQSQDRFTGMFPAKEHLMLFKENSCHLVIGDFDETGFFRFRLDDLSLTAGLSSYQTLKQLSDGTLRGLDTKGVWRWDENGPVEVSGAILPVFTALPSGTTDQFVFNRAIAFYLENQEQYVIFIPKESLNGSDRYANSSSRLFYLDTATGEFFEWDNMNMEAGTIVDGDDVYWVERRLSTFSSAVTYGLYKRLRLDGDYSQTDHGTPIEWSYFTGWDNRQAPAVPKKPIRLRVTATSSSRSAFYTLAVEQYINYEAGQIITRFAFPFGAGASSGYGIAAYGAGPYGDPGSAGLTRKLKRRKCEAWAYSLWHQKNYETPLITTLETEFAAPHMLGIKSGSGGTVVAIPSTEEGGGFDPFS